MYFAAIGPNFDRLQITEDMTHLPEDIDRISVDFTLNDEAWDLPDRTLIHLLRNSNKVKEVRVQNIDGDLSPESIELLEVIIAIAESLTIYQWQSDLAYSCLTSCLSQPNGLKELKFATNGGRTQMSINQAQLLFEGVASSSCLEVLSMIPATFELEEEENYESICNAFLDALQRSRSLKTLDFDVTPFVTTDWNIFPRIFKAALLDTRIETLSLYSDQFFNFPSNLLIEALCNDECKLKELSMGGTIALSPGGDDDQMPGDACNKSLEELAFMTGNLALSIVVDVARRCRSLVSLQMPQCIVGPHLSLLDPLLIGDGHLLSLQRLELFENGINEDLAIAFFRKLPQMTCIRKICLGHNGFIFSEAWVPVLVDAIQRNKSVEFLDLDDLSHYSPMPKEELAKACSKIDDALRRNQERRLTEEFLNLVRSKLLPEKLWPLVLERAQKPISLSLCKTYNGDRQPSESVMQKDLVNRLLKEKMLQDHLH